MRTPQELYRDWLIFINGLKPTKLTKEQENAIKEAQKNWIKNKVKQQTI